MKDSNDDFEHNFIAWCLNRGITSKTSLKNLLIAMAEDYEQKFVPAEAEQVIMSIHRNGSSTYDAIQLIKLSLETLVSKICER